MRELGTLKALGWTQRLIVRQIAAGELVALEGPSGSVGFDGVDLASLPDHALAELRLRPSASSSSSST